MSDQEIPRIHLDESGNTGEHLSDPAQPVFTLAAVHLDDATAARLAGILAGDGDEGHYTRLRRRASGQRRVIEVLSDAALRPGGTARVSVMHKATMIVAKFVDLVIEPAVDAQGGDLYDEGVAQMTADALIVHGPTVCSTTWDPLMSAFIAAARSPTSTTAAALSQRLAAAVIESDAHPIQRVLACGFAPPSVLLGRLHSGGDREPDHLYSEIGLITEQIGWWGEKLGTAIEVIYDESKVLGRWRELLLSLADPAVVARYQVTQSTGLDPLPLAAIGPADSQTTPALQVADTLAGACAELLRAEARGQSPSGWVAQLHELGVRRYVQHWVWTTVEGPRDEGAADAGR